MGVGRLVDFAFRGTFGKLSDQVILFCSFVLIQTNPKIKIRTLEKYKPAQIINAAEWFPYFMRNFPVLLIISLDF